jgi:hypothetical protein
MVYAIISLPDQGYLTLGTSKNVAPLHYISYRGQYFSYTYYNSALIPTAPVGRIPNPPPLDPALAINVVI